MRIKSRLEADSESVEGAVSVEDAISVVPVFRVNDGKQNRFLVSVELRQLTSAE